jgi:hypothetical protein
MNPEEKESKIDLLKENFDTFSHEINQKIESMDSLFQAHAKRMETFMAYISSNKNAITQDKHDESKLSGLTNVESSSRGDEFVELLAASKQLQSYLKKNDFRANKSNTNMLCITYFDLIKIGQLFENNVLMNKLKDFLVASLKPDSLKELLDDILNDYMELKSPIIAFELIEHRIKWIEDYLNNVPKFSWKMPNPVFVGNQNKSLIIDVVSEFLRSDQEKKTYVCGVSLDFARKLVYGFYWAPKTRTGETTLYEQKGYSVNMEANGVGRTSFIVMTKTKAYFDKRIEEYQSTCRVFQNELNKLKDFKSKLSNEFFYENIILFKFC